MVTPVVIAPNQKITALNASAIKQGQWANITGSSGGDFSELEVSPVNSDADAKLLANQLFPVMQYPADMEGAESTYETIAADSQVVCLMGSGIVIEDDMMATTVGATLAAEYAAATAGALMYLSAAGYLLFADSDDFVEASLPVAEFIGYANGILTYQTL